MTAAGTTGASRAARRRLRLVLLRAEASWWLMRPLFFVNGFLAAAGWLAAPGHPGYGRLAAMIGAMGLAAGLVIVLNDIVDAEKDTVTAPDMPLPSGLVSFPQAVFTSGCLALAVVGLLAVASTTPGRFLSGIAAAAIAGCLVVAYSVVKAHGLRATLVAAFAYTGIPATSFVVAGGRTGALVVAVLAYAFVVGVAHNLFAGVRDLETDPSVGNRTLAVRLGRRRALLVAAACDAVGFGCAIGVGISLEQAEVAVPVVAGALVTSAWGYRHALAGAGHGARRRSEYLAALWRASLGRIAGQLGLIAAFSPSLALALGVLAVVAVTGLEHAYRQRVVEGALRRELAMSAPAGGP